MLSRAGSRVSQSVTAFEARDNPALNLSPPATAKSHQRSRTMVDLPPLFSRTPSVSPTRSSTFMPFNRKSRDPLPDTKLSLDTPEDDSPDSETQRNPRAGTVGKIASWFDGASEPVNISLVPSPSKEKSEPFYQLDQSEPALLGSSASMDNLTRRTRKPLSASPSTANSSKFSFFRKAAPAPPKIDADELIQMDIRDALLPDGPVEEVTPASFKDFSSRAESLLKKFQLSYAENLGALRQITSEKQVQADELEAEKTRNEHLKMQLLEMAEKASEQEKIITSLKTQLANPQSSVRMIAEHDQITGRGHGRRNRVSDISASDDSFVDSEMSSAVSVFSDVDSIRTPCTSVSASPRIRHASLYNPTVMPGFPVQAQVTPVLVTQCQNCHNVPASEAWDVVDMMRMESAGLKQRIADLESANDSALEFLSSLKM